MTNEQKEKIKIITAYILMGFTIVLIFMSTLYLIDESDGHFAYLFNRGGEGGASNGLIYFGFIALSGSILMASINTKD